MNVVKILFLSLILPIQISTIKTKKGRIVNLSIILALLTTIIVSVPARVSATAAIEDEPEIISFEQHDLDGDSTPDKAVIMVGYIGGRYRVVIYDQGQDMESSNDWQIGTDFVNDLWLFQTETGEETKLIIRFSQGTEGYTAELFDDVNEDGTVSLRIQDSRQIEITESPFPSVLFAAEQPWKSLDGVVNYNVDITIYRPMPSLAGSDSWLNLLPQDGSPAVEQEIVDSDGDSIPDYELIRVFPDAPISWRLQRTYININIGKTPLPGFSGSFFWPYLGYVVNPEQFTSNDLFRRPDGLNQDKTPPVQVDWHRGKIMGVAHFLPLWAMGDQQWLLKSRTPLHEHVTVLLDGERWAYTSFSGTLNPDLVVMLRHHGYNSEAVDDGSQDQHLQQVQIAWHHNNPGTMKWEYKLEMAGPQEMPPNEVEFVDFSIQEVPFKDYLRYYHNQEWAYATFVAAEERKTASNEGIVEWGTLHGVVVDLSLPPDFQFLYDTEQAQRNYLLGRADVSPAEFYKDIREGFRGEYGDINGPAGLYFSPIDRKLHLLNAQKGVWNMIDEREIRYGNLGGEYINQWVLLENGKPLKNLYFVSGYIIYEGEGKLQITRTETPAAIFTTPPPRDQGEWDKLGRDLEQHKPTFTPDDFVAMIAQFEGPSASITGVSLRDLRLVENGFRFVLDLQPGYRLRGENWLAIKEASPGSYLISYDGDQIQASPSTSASPSVSTFEVQFEDGNLRQSQWASIALEMINQGSEDAHDLLLCVNLLGPLAAEETITTTIPLLAGKETLTVSMDWAPRSAGEWQLTAFTGCEGESVLGNNTPAQTLAMMSVEVQPQETPSWNWLLTLGGILYERTAFILMALILSLTLLAGGAAALWLRSPEAE